MTKSDIKRVLTMADAIEADRQAFRVFSAGEVRFDGRRLTVF